MRRGKQKRAFSVLEVTICSAIFCALSVLMFTALKEVAGVWQRSSGREMALGKILRAKARLSRDLSNSSGKAGQWATTTVGPNLGSGHDGDALTFLSADNGTSAGNWTIDPNTGEAQLASQITYYCVIPNTNNRWGINVSPGAPDPRGYEQQHPFKWLIRRVDPVIPGNPPSIDPGWTAWLTRPTQMIQTPQIQVVADDLLTFRMMPPPAPKWSFEISAIAIQEAAREIAVGQVPLRDVKFKITEFITITPQN